MKKERTVAQKLGWYKRELREKWHRSPMYWEAYNRAKVRPGVLKCEGCGNETNSKLIEMDHKDPIVDPGIPDQSIGDWAKRLNCAASGLQALCESCHCTKTTGENKRRVGGKRVSKS